MFVMCLQAERDTLLVERKQLQDRVSTLESHLQAVIDHSIDYRVCGMPFVDN